MAATWGTTPLNVTCSRNRAPAPANVEPVLHEGARVEQLVDALPHRRLLHRPLALDALGAAHAVGPLAPLRQVLDERLPVVELGGVSHQRPFQFGSRFSAKAAMPSAA